MDKEYINVIRKVYQETFGRNCGPRFEAMAMHLLTGEPTDVEITISKDSPTGELYWANLEKEMIQRNIPTIKSIS